jgi:hypothetical protein
MKLKVSTKMGLLNNNATAAVFEEDADTATATPEASQAPAAQAKAPKTTAIAPKAATGLVVAKPDFSALTVFKDALPVNYNTLAQIIATNGNFKDRESGKIMGDTIVFELMSYQDSYVVSPEDDDAPDDMVRYSNDGKTCSDGTDVQTHLEFLHTNGFPKAKLKQRVVVIGGVETAAKSDHLNGSLVQFDLSPTSKVQWDRYMANTAYKLNTGRVTAEGAKRVKAETTVAKGKGSDDYTLVTFNVAG